MKLLTRFEHHCCSRIKVRMKEGAGGVWVGGGAESPPPHVFEAQKIPIQKGLITLGLVT